MPRNLLSLVMPPNNRSPWPTAAHTSTGIVFSLRCEMWDARWTENAMDFRPPNKILTLGSPEEVLVAVRPCKNFMQVTSTNKNCYEIIHSVYIVHWVLHGRSKKLKALKPQDLRCQMIGSVLKQESTIFTATIRIQTTLQETFGTFKSWVQSLTFLLASKVENSKSVSLLEKTELNRLDLATMREWLRP